MYKYTVDQKIWFKCERSESVGNEYCWSTRDKSSGASPYTMNNVDPNVMDPNVIHPNVVDPNLTIIQTLKFCDN